MKFSIVIPSYNQGRFVERTLESVLNQEEVDSEVLVFDGGSTDETLSILEKYSDHIAWRSGKDGGQADAINRGLHISTGDVLAYLNSDDVYYPGALKRVAEHFRQNPECSIVYGHGDHIDEDDKVIEPYPTEPWNYERLGEVCFLCQPAVFWRREVIERFGYFDDRLHYALDYEYWLRVGQEMDFHFLEGPPLAGSRMYEENKTMSRRLPAHREILKVAIRYDRNPYQWLKALSHVSIEEDPQKHCEPGTPEFSVEFVERTLRFANKFEIVLPTEECRELENHLRGAGL